jgi:lipid-binding SYLF domain-containing protein
MKRIGAASLARPVRCRCLQNRLQLGRNEDQTQPDKFTIGGDASAAAGPVGRTGAADTDILLHAEILSYSRTRGVFAGISLDGTVVSRDGSEDRKLYGHGLRSQDVLTGEVVRQ